MCVVAFRRRRFLVRSATVCLFRSLRECGEGAEKANTVTTMKTTNEPIRRINMARHLRDMAVVCGGVAFGIFLTSH